MMSTRREIRHPKDYQKIKVSTCQMISLYLTPAFCRSPHLTALSKLMKKAENKLHREMDIGQFLKRLRDTVNMVASFKTSRCFNPSTLFSDYQYHYSNVVDVGLQTDKSIEEEYALPIAIDYFDPAPVCVCPDLGEENLVRIADIAYNLLK